mmetsp:Transcript_1261/g.3466  ORF Transcript_1261/g.3466 Transcript_1261/m.3466 type:complete len:222 (+) Transcript_1261:456-1121(+)
MTSLYVLTRKSFLHMPLDCHHSLNLPSATRGAPKTTVASGVRLQPSSSAMVAARTARAPPRLWPVKTTFQSVGTGSVNDNTDPTSHFFTRGRTRFKEWMKPSCAIVSFPPPRSRAVRFKSVSTSQFFIEVICVPRKTSTATFALRDLSTRACKLSLLSFSIVSSQSWILGHRSDFPFRPSPLMSASNFRLSTASSPMCPNAFHTELVNLCIMPDFAAFTFS